MNKIRHLIAFCLSIFFILGSTTFAKGQSIYYDAIFLSKSSNLSADGSLKPTDSIYSVLAKYSTHTSPSNSDLDAEFDGSPGKNPFITIAGGPHALKKFGGIQSALSSIGGLDVTTYANAAANIMIDHAKEELTVAFFSRFKKAAAEYPEFAVLFPKTTDNLSNLLSYKYPEMLPTLRTGCFEDIKQLTYRLDDVLELPKYRELLKNFPEIKITIHSLKLIQEIESGSSNAADIIKEFSEFNEWNDNTTPADFRNMGNTLKLSSVFSESFRNANKDSIWVSPKQVKNIVKSKTAFNIYLGLLYQTSINQKIQFTLKKGNADTTFSFSAVMMNNKDNLELFQSKVEEFIALANKVETSYHNIHDELNSNKKVTDEDVYNYINVSIDIIDYSFSIAQLFDQKLDANEYIALARNTNNLYKDIYNKQYNQAVSHAFDILLTVHDLIDNHTIENNGGNILKASYTGLANASTTQQQSIKKLAQGKAKRSDVTIANTFNPSDKPKDIDKLVAYYNSKESLDTLADFIEKIKPYALFMANIVSAQNEDEIKSALENAILPVGSSSIKKYSNFNLSIQSYLGAYWGGTSAVQTKQTAWNDKFGVIAPIGLSFNYGMKKAGSVGAFISLLDIGAIVDYKLTSDSLPNSNGTMSASVKKEYKINLGQIIAPGTYIVYGFPFNFPLSLGIGGQYGPGLSKINVAGETVTNNPLWRWNAFISVDIPFTTIINHPKRSK